MVRKSSTRNPVWLLFILALVLLSAGWLMKLFPVFMFVGMAPLFAISDQVKDQKSIWNKVELILMVLGFAFLASTFYDPSRLVWMLAQSIIFTFAFVGYAFCYQNLGSRLGKFTIVFFWLALEYLLLNLPWRSEFTFLADSFQLQSQWVRWNYHTGYLGASLWILVTNLFFYFAFFREKRINGYYLAMALLIAVGPIAYSQILTKTPLNYELMISLYEERGADQATTYQQQGEFVARTAAWVSVLIILLAFVKNKTRKNEFTGPREKRN